jgi:DNA repair exonuclease SbcCD ATPase subunit
MSLQEVRAELNQISAQADAVAEQMTKLATRRNNMQGVWNFFRRREITERIAEFDEARVAVGAELERLKGTSQMRKATRLPEFPGLSIAGKQLVNLQLIAFAQELYLWFRQHELPELAREAAICQVTDVRYGDAARCEFLTEHIARRTRQLTADTGLLMRTAERAAWLAKQVEYRNETDTIPESASLSLLVVSVKQPTEYAPINVNVLSQEYWDICSVLVSA